MAIAGTDVKILAALKERKIVSTGSAESIDYDARGFTHADLHLSAIAGGGATVDLQGVFTSSSDESTFVSLLGDVGGTLSAAGVRTVDIRSCDRVRIKGTSTSSFTAFLTLRTEINS